MYRTSPKIVSIEGLHCTFTIYSSKHFKPRLSAIVSKTLTKNASYPLQKRLGVRNGSDSKRTLSGNHRSSCQLVVFALASKLLRSHPYARYPLVGCWLRYPVVKWTRQLKKHRRSFARNLLLRFYSIWATVLNQFGAGGLCVMLVVFFF